MARVSLGTTPAALAALVLALILAGCTPASFGPRDSGGGGQGGGSEAGQDPDGEGTDDGAGPPDGGGEVDPDAGGGDDGADVDGGAGGSGGADAPDDSPADVAGDLSSDTSLDVSLDGSPDASSDGPNDAPPLMGVMPTVAGQLVISEIMMDTSAITDDDGEWFEIYNPSTSVVYDLNGCVLSSTPSGGPMTVMQSLIIAPGAFASLARSGDPMMAGFTPTYTYGATLKFSNSGGTINVICGAGATTLIDTASYTIDQVIKGSSLSLNPDHYDAADNDVPANWCHCSIPYHSTIMGTDYGTPGMPNPRCP